MVIFFGADLAKRTSRLFVKKPHYNYDMSQEMFEVINDERKERDLDPLLWYDILEAAAAMGENIAKGFDDIETVLIGFMESESHRDAILSKQYKNVTCAVYYENGIYYFVQLFN